MEEKEKNKFDLEITETNRLAQTSILKLFTGWGCTHQETLKDSSRQL